MEKSDAGFFYSPKRRPTLVSGRDFHCRSNGVVSLREERALCPLPSYEGKNRRRTRERFLFNRNILFTHPNEKIKLQDMENKRNEYQQAVRIFESRRVERSQSIIFKNEMTMEKDRRNE
jgi:hypothetical protein